MPKIREVRDSGPNPNTPTVKDMRASQSKGSTGTGFDVPYADKMAARNHGTGKGEGKDEQFPVAADYKESSDEGSGLPWD